jgi:hypothetical protein
MNLNATSGDVSNPHINIFSHRGVTNSSEANTQVPSSVKVEPQMQQAEMHKPVMYINPSFGEIPDVHTF